MGRWSRVTPSKRIGYNLSFCVVRKRQERAIHSSSFGRPPPALLPQTPLRLTHIKLAGFKSFVDPTPIATPGQLVGIVGPNGCGK